MSAMIGQPVLAWGRFPRKFGLDSAQSERPQQELYARCSRRSLRRIADNALRRCPGTNALSDVTVRAVRWPALQGHSVTPGWVRRDGTFEAADHGSRGIGRQILVAALAIGSKLVIVRYGVRLEFQTLRRRSGVDRGVVLRALASIEHAVVPDDAHDAVASAGNASSGERLESLRRESITPRRQQSQFPLVVNAGENVVVD